METSAKLNTGIDELFQSLASSILSNTLKSLQDISNSNSLGVQKCSTEDNDVLMRSGTIGIAYRLTIKLIDKIKMSNDYLISRYFHIFLSGNRRSLRDWSNNISVRGVSFRR